MRDEKRCGTCVHGEVVEWCGDAVHCRAPIPLAVFDERITMDPTMRHDCPAWCPPEALEQVPEQGRLR